MTDKLKKILLNPFEEKTDAVLRSVLEHNGYRVCPKVRTADIFSIDHSGLSNEQYSYALKSHFDFTVIGADNLPVFSVEFDGQQHQTDADARRRDRLKGEICNSFEYPLVRIDAGFFKEVGQFTILSWMIEVWCLSCAFYEAQEKGQVPFDEPFLYSSFLSSTLGGPITFPYDPFRKYRIFFHRESEKKLIESPSPNSITYDEDDGNTYCMCFIRLDQKVGLAVRTKVKSYRYFPVSSSELAEETAVMQLYEKYLIYRENRSGAESFVTLARQFDNIQSGKKVRCASFSSMKP